MFAIFGTFKNHLKKDSPKYKILDVFDIVGLIEDHIKPPFPPENLFVLDCKFVGSNANVEGINSAPSLEILRYSQRKLFTKRFIFLSFGVPK